MPAPQDLVEGRPRRAIPPPILVDGVEEYEVKKILNSLILRRTLQFLIKWKGYGYEDISWENADTVHASDLVADYYRNHPGAAGDSANEDVCP